MDEPRRSLIENAVKFLQDPQVKSSGLERQISFLKSKGLTESEINEAIIQAGLPNNPDALTEGSNTLLGLPHNHGARAIPPHNTSIPLPNTSIPLHNTSVPPPLPTSPPPSRAVMVKPFDWGKFFILIALGGSAMAALSQSKLAVQVCVEI
jgi:peroxin-14